MEQNQNTSGIHPVQTNTAAEGICKFSFQYLTQCQQIKAHRAVIRALKKKEQESINDKIKAECREIISENEHQLKELQDILRNEYAKCLTEKTKLEEYLKLSDYSHEWVDIQSKVGLYINKISKIKEVI